MYKHSLWIGLGSIVSLLTLVASAAHADDSLARGLRYEARAVQPLDTPVVDIGVLRSEASTLRSAVRIQSMREQMTDVDAANIQSLDANQLRTLQDAANIFNRRAGGTSSTSGMLGIQQEGLDDDLGAQPQVFAPNTQSYAALASALEEGARVARTAVIAQGGRRRLSLQSLRDMGFSLRESPDAPGNVKPALFSYFRDFESDETVWTARFALLYSGKPVQSGNWSRSLTASISGNLTTRDDDETNDAWQFRGGMQFVWNGSDGAPIGRKTRIVITRAQLKYEQSQDSRVKKLSGVVTVDPKFGALALGVRRGFEYGYSEATGCCPPRNIVSWQWQARGVGNFGTTIDAGDSEESDSTLVRFRGDLIGTIYFDALGRSVLGRRFLTDSSAIPKVEFGFTAYYHPLEDETFHHLFSVSLKIPFNEVISLSAKYLNGEEAPKFNRVETLLIGLGIEF